MSHNYTVFITNFTTSFVLFLLIPVIVIFRLHLSHGQTNIIFLSHPPTVTTPYIPNPQLLHLILGVVFLITLHHLLQNLHSFGNQFSIFSISVTYFPVVFWCLSEVCLVIFVGDHVLYRCNFIYICIQGFRSNTFSCLNIFSDVASSQSICHPVTVGFL